MTREEARAIIQAKCQFSDPAAVWVAIETHRFADDLYRKLAGAMM
jgi:regulator of RNase E activity RraB